MTAHPQTVAFARTGSTPDTENEALGWGTVVARLDAIVALLRSLLQVAVKSSVEAAVRDRYTTEEVAEKLGKRPRTTQKWCRDGQVNCIRLTRDGTYRVTSEEVERVRSHGLLAPGTGQVVEE